jgi:phytanoyl-CoA hydroxylase
MPTKRNMSCERDGYSILRDAFSPREVDELRREATLLCRGGCGPVQGLTPVAANESDEDVLRRVLCIHFPHKISDRFRRALSHPAVVHELGRLIGPNVKCMQSMLFIKGPGQPGQAWHQDEIYIPTRDRSLTGAWIALDDATVENGCLWLLPGSHLRGVLYRQEPHFDPRFDGAEASCGFPDDEKSAIPAEMSAGSVLMFHGYVLHRSLPNRAKTGLRRALVNHYMSAESLLPWQTAAGPAFDQDWRDIEMVLGDDPYAYKGIVDRARPHVRGAA